MNELVNERKVPARNRVRRALLHVIGIFHRWAESGWAGSAVGSWAFLQGSVVPGPSDALLIPLGLADPRRAFPLAAWAIAGATLGGIVAYAIGLYAFDTVGRPLLDLVGVSPRTLASYQGQFERRGWMIVVLSTVSPLSTKIVCLAAGSFEVPAWQFVLALAGGRTMRFLGVAALIRFAGERLTARLERMAGRPVGALR